ncbi:MAG: FtsX-like permease family protein [Bacteroidales bacterium]
MFRQALYTLLRRIAKDKVLYLIIITNLAVGFAAFVVLTQFITDQFSYDKFNTRYDRIYRLQLFMDQKENSEKHTWSVTAALSRKDLVDLPEIEKICLMHDVGDNNKSGIFLSVDKKNQFLIRYGYYADQTVFDIFTLKFIEGDPKQALVQPMSIVLSKYVADKLFPGGNALGKQVYGENKVVFIVTGVYENLPVKSTWRPVFLLPMLSFRNLEGWEGYEKDYWSYSFYTYVLLKANTVSSSVDNKIYSALKDFRKEHHPYLRPMSKLYIDPYFENRMPVIIGLVAFLSVLILVLSSINFINLQTANATTRFREIGIKKTAGFNKKQLWYQFMFESMGLTLLGALIGLFIAQLAFTPLNTMLGAEIFSGTFRNWKLVTVIFLVTLLTGILSGLHPAYIISSFNPVAALKQKFINEQSNGISLKRVLVTIQFSISIFMLIVGFIIYRQTQFMLNKDLGFNSQTILFSNIVTNRKGSIEPLRQKLLQHQEIKSVCVSDYIPFILPGGDDMNWEGNNPQERVFVRFSNISYDFVKTYDLKMLSGRDFSRDYPADGNKCLINETAARIFGWKDAVGKHFKIYDRKDVEVIGVIKDYIVSSVYSSLEPHLYRLVQDSIINNGVYSVNFTTGEEKKAMEIVKQEFEQFFPEDAFEFRNIQFLTRNETAVKAFLGFRKIIALTAILTIIISSIGLFGLILFLTQRKMREVGIRRVLGFSSGSLYMTLSSEIIMLLFLSVVLAWPAAYYVYRVLPAGANKYSLQIWEFLIATLIILVVAIGTISYQIIRALRVKPVDILKDE